jgi:hypothetical protein
MSAVLRTTFGRAFRRAAMPLGWYYAVTLALPLANGAADAGSAFAWHALAVLAMPPILVGLACTVHVGVLRIVTCLISRHRGRMCLDVIDERLRGNRLAIPASGRAARDGHRRPPVDPDLHVATGRDVSGLLVRRRPDATRANGERR